ncbi:MAG: hypothetical protein Q7U05_00975 [Polaromonas sp.]|nr:hypothetical protein [Polaromonas sp.]
MSNFAKLYRLATFLLVFGASMVCVAVGQVVVWAMDRTPPFVVNSYTSSPTHRGETAKIKVTVKRDLTRMCSVTYSRMFLDAKGVAWDLTEGVRLMTAKSLDELDKRNPDMLAIKIKVPDQAAVGKGSVMTVLEYVCNPVHQLYPIPMVMVTDVDVLPKKE